MTMELASRPDVGLALYDFLPKGLEDEFVEALSAEHVDVKAVRISSGPYAGLELYLPAAIGLYLASNYFGGALQKAGEEHYLAVKEAAKKLWRRSTGFRIGAIGSAGKVSASPKFSISYSITGEVVPRLSFKLVFRLDVGQGEAASAIDAFLDLLRNLHSGELSDEDFAALLTHKPIGGVALVTFDPMEKRIVPIDPFDDLNLKKQK